MNSCDGMGCNWEGYQQYEYQRQTEQLGMVNENSKRKRKNEKERNNIIKKLIWKRRKRLENILEYVN